MQAALVELSRPIRLVHGQELFRRWEYGSGLYCVLGGALLVNNVDEEGRIAVLCQVEPCQWIGEVSTLDRGPRHFSAHANGATELLFVPGDAIESWLNQHPLCWRDIGILACNKFRMALDVFQDNAFMSLEQRILKRLEWIATGYGSRVKPLKRVRVPQEVIAQMMGVSRQSTNKAMKTLEAVGLISRSYGVVELHNRVLEPQSPDETTRVGRNELRVQEDVQGPETVF
ncbi:MAG TPA: Crp/Fnr family transcriptional regulator [Hydrogenophaga sp.]|nr:Crp/Fnr family transcriptional regulator [Hydrogenophaga sp.]